MAKERQNPAEMTSRPGSARAVRETVGPVAFFLTGPRAKWLFFAVYFILTIFVFRDFIFSNDMLFGGDTIPDGVYTRKYYKEYHEQYGGVPRWNPYILGGLPFIDAMHGDTFYPGAWLKFFIPLTRALGHKLVWHLFLAGVLMYLFLRTLKFRRDASFLGGLIYMLAPSFVSLVYPGHDAKMYVIAWLPLAFLFLERGMERPRFVSFVMLGAVMGLLVLTSHAQMAYYSYWAIGLYFVFKLLTGEKKTPYGMGVRTVLFGLSVVLAVFLGAVQLLPAYKFSTTQSVRTGVERSNYEYATSWSMHPEEAAGMIVPSFQGNTFIDGRRGKLFEADYYWGRNTFKLNSEYHGILPIIFALLALWFCRSKLSWFMSGLGVMSLIYALGATTPFYRLFYALVPGVKTFRAPSMIIFLFCFAVVVMASEFFSRLLDRETSIRPADRRLWYIAGCFVIAAFITTILGRGFFDAWVSIFYRAIDEGNAQAMIANLSVFTSDLWRIAILASLSLIGVWLFSARKIGAPALVSLFALVNIVDQTVVDARFITVIDPSTYPTIAADESVRELETRLKKDGHFRTLSMLAQRHSGNYYAMFGIPLADGFHNNELKTYELFRGGNRNVNYLKGWLDLSTFAFEPSNITTNNYLKAAGVRYILIPGETKTQVLENSAALPRAYIVHDYIAVPNDTMAVAMLGDPSFDAAKTVVVDNAGTFPFAPVKDAPSSMVESFEYTRDGSRCTASFTVPGFLVVSDNYLPSWQATVDGNPIGIVKANGTFMAIPCFAGRHEIVLSYRSVPFETGRRMTQAAIAVIALTLAVSCGMTILKRRKTGQ